MIAESASSSFPPRASRYPGRVVGTWGVGVCVTQGGLATALEPINSLFSLGPALLLAESLEIFILWLYFKCLLSCLGSINEAPFEYYENYVNNENVRIRYLFN